MTRRRDPHSYTRVLLPEADLAELVLELATPLLADLGASPRIEAARRTLDLVITFWNAHVLASKLWERPRLKELNELKKRMRGRNASREDAITFDLLTSRWRKHAAEPRLVESWVYEHDDSGTPRLTCTMCLPEGVKEWRPPPIEARIAIGGRLLDEVRIALGVNQFLTFPVSRHHGEIGPDGTATIYATMPTALQLFAEGVLPRLRSNDAVEVMVSGRQLGPMVLAEMRCSSSSPNLNDLAVLVFKPRADSHE
ncbi:MAG: hypothetical protein BGO98_25565 [Myxococcales bacterium 68-20]|nr:hypothetical protein [Myxococcales bacterium]OJY16017.1 MAG: hypothetical protein BGO98_25565 [Myxococcales bacterium 68-20]